LNSLHPRWATAPPAAPAGDAAPCSRRQRRKSPCQAWFGATATMRKYQNHWLQREGLGLGTLIWHDVIADSDDMKKIILYMSMYTVYYIDMNVIWKWHEMMFLLVKSMQGQLPQGGFPNSFASSLVHN
jgi:hypothetical protein